MLKDSSTINFIKINLPKLFSCVHVAGVKYKVGVGIRGKVKNCKDANSRVIKTIRLRYSTIQSWIVDTDIKVHVP